MDQFNQNVAMNLRRIRKQKRMSLDDMARETGLSKSMLGQIERGEANPTLGTVGKLLNGLHVGLLDLLEAPKDANFLVRRTELKPFQEQKGAYASFLYFPQGENRKFEIYEMVISPGQEYRGMTPGEGAMVYLLLTAGTMRLEVGAQQYSLTQGDAICFYAGQPYVYGCTGEHPLHLVLVLYWI